MKYCTKCQEYKQLEEYWKNKCTKDGFQTWCKPCWKVITAKRRNGPKREIELRQRMDRHLVRTYGISLEVYEKMLADQSYACAICKQQESERNRKLAVDHDHKTGKIRGLLCGRCNKAIGLFEDDTDKLRAAIRYLRWW